MPQQNLNVNGTTFQSGLRFQTGSSSLQASCKRSVRQDLIYMQQNLEYFITGKTCFLKSDLNRGCFLIYFCTCYIC